MNRTVEVLSDKAALVERSLQIVVERLQTAIAERGYGTIALSGGSTPKPLYEAIAKQDLPWDKVHVFWGDERYVPATHPDSNEGMARAAWLDQVEIPAKNIHPMPTLHPQPADSAVQHEQELQSFFQTQPGEFPQFDVILLGIGDDGHTASLFPHTEALKANGLVTVGNKDGQPRITFTAVLINQARCVLFMVAGASKQEALAHILAPEDDSQHYPARLIQPQGELIWLLDSAAGEKVEA
ncbi:MAG: 6-phosphogluconolactonase [Elainellaceae cyanobacterium]